MPRRADNSGRAPDYIGMGVEGPPGRWWHDLLRLHPAISAPQRPLRFFDEFCARPMTEDDVATYHRRFSGAQGRTAGEWTPSYLADGWVAPLLRRAAPDARILVMVSDPIERFRAVRATRAAAQPDEKRLLVSDVVDRVGYASQLQRLRRYYPSTRILVLQYERCRRAPLEEYLRTLRFLGVDDVGIPPRLRLALGGRSGRLLRILGVPRAPRTGAVAPLWDELEASLHAALDQEVLQLQRDVGTLDLTLWPNFVQLAGDVSSLAVAPEPSVADRDG
jgi:hypothetical protein